MISPPVAANDDPTSIFSHERLNATNHLRRSHQIAVMATFRQLYPIKMVDYDDFRRQAALISRIERAGQFRPRSNL